MLALPFCHDDPQQDDEQDNDHSNRKQIEELSASWILQFTCKFRDRDNDVETATSSYQQG